jgi:glutamine synthetase
MKSITIYEYIWLAKDQSLRSKSRTLVQEIDGVREKRELDELPLKERKNLEWTYDGSSTGQADGKKSEVILKPCAMYNDPFRGPPHKLLLCEGVDENNVPVSGYNREKAEKIFKNRMHEEPWYGIEQEYVLMIDNKPLGFPENGYPSPQGPYYCGVGTESVVGRQIAEEHYQLCLDAGLTISGINAEVMLGQWEYQVGPCKGIDSGDELWMSRYIMHRVCENHGVSFNLEPKPVEGDWNGSGAHTNFSTKTMRENGSKEYLHNLLDKLVNNHKLHIENYGKDNDKRLTGNHETSSLEKCTYGAGDRGASIRISRELVKSNYKSGYIEDRRPSSNMDPYLVTSLLAETCIDVLDEEAETKPLIDNLENEFSEGPDIHGTDCGRY